MSLAEYFNLVLAIMIVDKRNKYKIDKTLAQYYSFGSGFLV